MYSVLFLDLNYVMLLIFKMIFFFNFLIDIEEINLYLNDILYFNVDVLENMLLSIVCFVDGNFVLIICFSRG